MSSFIHFRSSCFHEETKTSPFVEYISPSSNITQVCGLADVFYIAQRLRLVGESTETANEVYILAPLNNVELLT